MYAYEEVMMAVYYNEIKKITEKLFQKFIQLSKFDLNYEARDYSFLELLVLKRINNSHVDLTINQWLDEFDLKNQTVNATLKKLISNGDLRKVKSESDQRKTFIMPTDKGKKVMALFYASEDEILDFILKEMTVNEEKAILKFLSKLNQLTVEKYNENNPLK